MAFLIDACQPDQDIVIPEAAPIRGLLMHAASNTGTGSGLMDHALRDHLCDFKLVNLVDFVAAVTTSGILMHSEHM